jgi:hypothetical protein
MSGREGEIVKTGWHISRRYSVFDDSSEGTEKRGDGVCQV